MMLTYPDIDPVLLHLGPLTVRWYSLAYIAGFLAGLHIAKRANAKYKLVPLDAQQLDDFLLYAVPGVILGGRFGYVLFYNLAFYLERPAQIFRLWEGGMSFHGGLTGFALAALLFCKVKKISPLAFAGLPALAAAPGLFFGRLANFINGELFGRVTDSPLGMIFPEGGPLPRHPSQLYEAVLEGPMLLGLLILTAAKAGRDRGLSGNKQAFGALLCGVFLLAYGSFRAFVEFFREPDAQIGFLLPGLTMGQLLSAPVFAAGACLLAYAAGRRKKVTN